MKTGLVTLGAIGVLSAGVAIHHSGHCPLMEMKKAFTHHATPAVAEKQTVKPNTVVLVSAKEDVAR